MGSKLGIYTVKQIPKNKKSIFQRIDQFVNNNFYIQFNEIGLDYEIKSIGDDLKPKPLNFASLYVAMINAGEKLSDKSLKTYLKSDYVTRYNPIIHYFKKLPDWDGVDYIKQYASYVNTDDDELFANHLKKWCVRAIRSILDPNKINKHCLVLANGEQHAGKSTYINYLIPKELKVYSSENIGTDKDSRIKLCKTFIINLEELDVLGKSDINELKAFISHTWVNERLPYTSKSENIPRISSFIGSTNLKHFLNDKTGSVRWIVFTVLGKLDFSYSKKGEEFNIDNLWSQAYKLALDPEFNAELTVEDVRVNEQRNKAYQTQSVEDELILTYYTYSKDKNDFRTASDIVEELRPLGHRLSNVKIGTALKGAKFKSDRSSKRGGIHGYLAKPKFKNSPIELKK